MICEKYLLCKHSNIKPRYCLSQFLSVAINQEMELRAKYKCDGPEILSLNECQKCLIQFTSINIRAELELELFTELNKIKPFEGPWFLVSSL